MSPEGETDGSSRMSLRRIHCRGTAPERPRPGAPVRADIETVSLADLIVLAGCAGVENPRKRPATT